MAGSRSRAGARSVLAGADRASGERQVRRRRTTPLLAARDGEAPTEHVEPVEPPVKKATAKAPAKKAVAKKAVAKKAVAEKAVAEKSAPRATKAPAAKAAAVKAPVKKTAATKKAPVTPIVAARAPEPARTSSGAGSSSGTTPGMRPAFRPAPAGGEAPPTPRVAAAVAANTPLPEGGTQSMAWMMVAQMGEALADIVGEAVADSVKSAELPEKVTEILGYVGRRLSGDYDLDDFGFDPEFTDLVWMGLMRPIYRRWFRVEVRGIENLPSAGGALIVANHSGTVPVDALMTAIAVHDEHPEHRFMRTLAADLVFQLPFVSNLARRTGSTLASNPDAERLLSEGNLVGVWPEGFKGVGKPFSERYKLQRFGRGGFVSAALRTRTPIVPCSIVGAEEIYPIVGNIPSLARLMGVPYIPITPFFPWLGLLGAVPLPSKWLIEFGPPLRTDQYADGAEDDPMLVFDLTDQVRQSIQQTLYALLVQRRSIFF